MIWNSIIPTTVIFFCWRLWQGLIPVDVVIPSCIADQIWCHFSDIFHITLSVDGGFSVSLSVLAFLGDSSSQCVCIFFYSYGECPILEAELKAILDRWLIYLFQRAGIVIAISSTALRIYPDVTIA
ncbi:hypothetical protein Adt_39842 [Abeliophyllum distichum]|uniref:Uncharacterized protein n=1 Tax=Abeliophyllum distichum TaxID=126358 RepID=A0ABD1Q6B1_9LAMI